MVSLRDNDLSQMVIADVMFSPDHLTCFRARKWSRLTVLTLTTKYKGFDEVYHFTYGIPMSSGTPYNPFLQLVFSTWLINMVQPSYGQPSTNVHPVQIPQTSWPTRFRTHSTVADIFFTRFGQEMPNKDISDCGEVMVIENDGTHITRPQEAKVFPCIRLQSSLVI